MKLNIALGGALAAIFSTVNAAAVRGRPEGFGSKATGGGSGPTVTPKTNAELTNYLRQQGPLNIIVTKTFDFRGTEGKATETGCAPYGTAPACQLAINSNNWCPKTAPKAQVTYDKAAKNPLMVSSDKTVLGVGRNGVILGKGFRVAGGANNVILQNLEIRDLNPQYVWGGDAITLDGSSNVWVDHIRVRLHATLFLRTSVSMSTANHSDRHLSSAASTSSPVTPKTPASQSPTTSSTARPNGPPAATPTTTGPCT
jgi:pectin lyase